MSDDLTGSQIALLCDIGEHDLSKASEEQMREMDRLIARGYAEPVEDDGVCPVRLTPRGYSLLAERGATLNQG